ncbi:hypothetical protein BY458DRAFT_497578 [Sporodiniella umbellata]|nr:hypothetical protein BY458DRAFT_497578 [Sporodiniella umbellata]
MTPTRLTVNNQVYVPRSPPSPTHSTASFMSVSWMAEKTSTELIPMLKNAYSALKDKEKDLVLAAELGKSLLEHNLRLKTSYDSLLHNTPPITPSTSTSSQYIQEPQEEEEGGMRFIPSPAAREAMIEVLEKKNSELSSKLEQAVTEQEQLIKTNSKSARKLENEISLLKGNLDIATSKIQELEDINNRQRRLEESRRVRPSAVAVEEELVEELYQEMNRMEQEKVAVEDSKRELEAKLVVTLHDLSDLKQQFDQFEFTQRDVQELQDAYERQFVHIEELKSSLEDHRAMLQKLRERGVALPTSATPSLCSLESEHKKPSLLGELESQWFKHSNSLKELTETSFAAICPTPSLTGLESVLSKATGMDSQAIDEALQFIQQIEAEHFQEKAMVLYQQDVASELDSIDPSAYPAANLYPILAHSQPPQLLQEPTTLLARLTRHLRSLFYLFWKWCRFSMVITTALFISAWQGPDALLIA